MIHTLYVLLLAQERNSLDIAIETPVEFTSPRCILPPIRETCAKDVVIVVKISPFFYC
jgi:hypothetical protein